MHKPHYNIVIIGAGCAGLSLAWELSRSKYPFKSLLLTDIRHPEEIPDRYYSFWSKEKLPFAHVIRNSWEKARVVDVNWKETELLTPYSFHLIHFKEYQRFLLNKIQEDQRISLSFGVSPEYSADWIFDSSNINTPIEPAFYMHSTAWEIQTERDHLQPDIMTFCDFPFDIEPGAFHYVLPLSQRQAIIYYVKWSLSSASIVPKSRLALKKYLSSFSPYKMTHEEHGIIPLFKPKSRHINTNTMSIGARGGLVRACTGYGMTRIWEDSRNITHSLEKYNDPFKVPNDPRLTRIGDLAFRLLIKKYPSNARVVLRRLFEHNPTPAALEFLDGSHFSPRSALTMLQVSPWPFLRKF